MAKRIPSLPADFNRGHYYNHVPSLAHAALIGAGELRAKQHRCEQRTLNDFALVYLVAGEGFFSWAGGPAQRVTAGDVLLLVPGVTHSYGPTAPGQWDEYWLMCSGEVFAGLQSIGLVDAQRPLWRPGLQAGLIADFHRLVSERLTSVEQTRSPRLALAMEATLAAESHRLITRLALADAADAPVLPAWLIHACTQLDADLARPVDLRRVAESCSMTYATFRKAFTTAMASPPARYRLERRIDRAKAMLTAGSTPACVADALGFCDVYFFSRQFRLVTATTPGRFCGSRLSRRS